MIYCRVKREKTPKHRGDVPEEEAEEMKRGEAGVQENVHTMGMEKYEIMELINPSSLYPSIFCYLPLIPNRGCVGDGWGLFQESLGKRQEDRSPGRRECEASCHEATVLIATPKSSTRVSLNASPEAQSWRSFPTFSLSLHLKTNWNGILKFFTPQINQNISKFLAVTSFAGVVREM